MRHGRAGGQHPGMSTQTSPARALRAPGLAALIAGIAFLLQPAFVFLFPAPDGAEFLPPDRLGGLTLRWTLQAIVWGIFSGATLLLVVATSKLAPDRLWPRVATAFGVIGAAAWLAESAFRLSPMSQPAQHLASAPVSADVQGSILYALDVFTFGTTALDFIGVGAWLIGVGAARMLPISTALRAIAVITGAVTIALFYLLPALPLSAFAVCPLLIATGVELLVRARGASRRAEMPSSAAVGASGPSAE